MKKKKLRSYNYDYTTFKHVSSITYTQSAIKEDATPYDSVYKGNGIKKEGERSKYSHPYHILMTFVSNTKFKIDYTTLTAT